MPSVAVRSRPNGLPIAIAVSPTCDAGASRRTAAAWRCVGALPGSIVTTARSLDGSAPSTCAVDAARRPAPKRTTTRVGVADDVRVGDERAVVVDEEAGARARARCGSRRRPGWPGRRSRRRATGPCRARSACRRRPAAAGPLLVVVQQRAGGEGAAGDRRRDERHGGRRLAAGWCAAARRPAAPARRVRARPPRAPRAGAPPPPPQPRVPARTPGATRPSTDAGETSSPWRVGMPSSAVGKAVESRSLGSTAMAARRAFSRMAGSCCSARCRPSDPLSMDMYLPGLPSMARDLSAPAWAAQLTITDLDAGPGRRPARRRPDQRRARAPAPAARRRWRAYMVDLAAVRHGRRHLAAAGFRLVQGAGGRGRDRHRARDRARPARPASPPRASSPCSCSSTAWRRSSRRSSAAQLLHVTDWRGIFVVARRHRRGAARRGVGDARRDARARGNRHGGGLVATLRRLRAASCATASSWATRCRLGLAFARDGRLHRGLAVRAAGHLRASRRSCSA